MLALVWLVVWVIFGGTLELWNAWLVSGIICCSISFINLWRRAR